MELRLPRFLWLTAKDKSHFPEKPLALVKALSKDQAGTVRKIISEKVSLETKDPDGLTAMDYAARYSRDGESIQVLIENGAAINSRTKHGFTPLMIAAGYGNPAMTEALLDRGADVSIKGPSGASTLITALAIEADEGSVSMLIEAGSDPNDKDNEGITALMYSTGLSAEVTELLIEKGADINACTEDGVNSLMFALEQDNFLPILDVLISSGADISQKDNLGLTPLMLAAADDSKLEAVDYLIQKGADVNAKADDGRTALMIACQFTQDPAIVQRLLDAGADPSLTDSNGFTAYDHIPDESPLLDEDDLADLLLAMEYNS